MRKPLFIALITLFYALSYIPGAQAEVLIIDEGETTSASAAAETAETSAVQTAKIVDVDGEVRLFKKDSGEWQAAKKDDLIESGDQILTGASSTADIGYDDYLLNITHIKEKTKAEFQSINPTKIYLEDGTIFSALDGLDEDSGYQIATPTAVAGVRGTHFDVSYDKEKEEFSAASLPSGEENHTSIIYVTDPKQQSSSPVVLMENKQMDLRRGQPIAENLVRPASSQRLIAGQQAMQRLEKRMPQFQERRQEGRVQFEERRQQRMEQRMQQGQQSGLQNENRPEGGSNGQNNPNDMRGQGQNGEFRPQPNASGMPQQGQTENGRRPFMNQDGQNQNNRPPFNQQEQNQGFRPGGPMQDNRPGGPYEKRGEGMVPVDPERREGNFNQRPMDMKPQGQAGQFQPHQKPGGPMQQGQPQQQQQGQGAPKNAGGPGPGPRPPQRQ